MTGDQFSQKTPLASWVYFERAVTLRLPVATHGLGLTLLDRESLPGSAVQLSG